MSDRLYVIERLGGKFRVDGGIWKENGTARANRVGEITEVHDDHIIGRLGDGEPTRFDLVGGRFDDVDGDISQAIEEVVEQPAQPQPDRLYIVEDPINAIEKSYTGGFSSNGFIWREGTDGGDAECVGKVKEVHSNYILGRLNNVDEIVRFDFVGERFDDVDDERSQEIIRHAEKPAAAQAEEKQPEPFEPIENETLFISLKDDGSINDGFSSVWKHSRGNDKLVCVVVAAIKRVNEDHIIVNFRDNGSLVETDVRLNITNNKFRDCNNDNAVEVVEPMQPEVTVGQYAFESGKFFGKVVKGDNEHIRIDGPNDYKCWFGINDARQRFKFHTIKPGMWLAPKTSEFHSKSCDHRLIDRIVPDPWLNNTSHPYVIDGNERSILFTDVIKNYDILPKDKHYHSVGFTEPTEPARPVDLNNAPQLTPPPVDLSKIRADKWNEILKPAQPPEHLFVFKDGECIGKVTSSSNVGGTWFIDRTDTIRPISVDEHEFITIKPGMVIEHIAGLSRRTIGAISLGNETVEPHLVTTDNTLIKLSDFAANWMVSNSEPAQHPNVVVGSKFYKHGKFWCEVTSLKHVDGKLVGNVKYSDGSTQIAAPVKISIYTDDPDMECRPPAWPQPLEIGTTFKFRTLPDRWAPSNPQNCLDNTFTVIEYHDHFEGEGQCVTRNDLSGVIFSVLFGVLSSDDIEILPAQQPQVDFDPKPRGNHESRIEQPAQQPDVFDEYGLSIDVGDDVFYKVSGELCGKVTELHEDNQITIELPSGSRVKCYNPQTSEQPWGFCPPNWGYTDNQRIMRIDRFETAEKTQPAPNGRQTQIREHFNLALGEVAKTVLPKYLPVEPAQHFKPVEGTMFVNMKDGAPLDKWKDDLWIRETRVGVPGEYSCGRIKEWHDNYVIARLDGKDELNKFYFTKNTFLDNTNDPSVEVVKASAPVKEDKKMCPRCNSLNRWQPSVYSERGTDFCAACHIWWTSGDRSKPIVDSKYPEPSAHETTRPAQPDPTLAKLEECGLSEPDAVAWINRNRPPVDLQNGDTIVTNTGIYRLSGNKWVKVGGNLRMRSKDYLPNSETIPVERVEHKFICDALPGDSASDACTEKIYIPIHGDHTDTVRPKGKPLSTIRASILKDVGQRSSQEDS